MKVKKIYSLLVHDTSQLEGEFGKNLYKILNNLKNKKFIKLGVSVYSREELEKIMSKFKIDIVNLPISKFCRRKLFIENKKKENRDPCKIYFFTRFVIVQKQ